MHRYDRNILIKEIGEEGQKKLLASKVLICGCGGLGSTVIANLASCGIGTIGLVDDDVIEISNLNRQYIHKFSEIGRIKVESAKDWINEFNPDIKVNIYNLRLDEKNYQEIVKDYDLIVDCFDSFSSKFLLNDIAVLTGKPLIYGGVTAFCGQIMTILPNKSACLRCIIPEAELLADVVKGIASPAVTTIASLQSMEVLKIILGEGELLTDNLLTFNGLTMDFNKLKISRSDSCPACGEF